MKKALTIICLTLAAFTAANAQTFVDGLRQDVPGQGKVTVTQTKEVEDLVNGKSTPPQASVPTPQTSVPAPPVQQPKQDAQQPKQDAQQPTQSQEAQKPDSTKKPQVTPLPTEETDEPTTPPDTRKKVMRRSYKMQGYRVQVFSGGNSRADRQKAETAGAVMKSNFPDQPIYTHFYSPSWKCRMGNYKTQAEAQAYLAKVRKLGYRQACIVKGTIQVQY